MTGRLALAGFAALTLVACGKPAPPPDQESAAQAPPDQEPPVPLNPDSPIQYPPRLYDQRVEGDVVMRLFVDSAGRLVAESSKVAESSGYSALDSAALAGVTKLHFAPARRHGLAVATAFLQPIEFRHPTGAGGRRSSPTSSPRRARSDTTAVRRPPRVLPETTSTRRDSVAAPESSAVRRDTSRAKADSGARPH